MADQNPQQQNADQNPKPIYDLSQPQAADLQVDAPIKLNQSPENNEVSKPDSVGFNLDKLEPTTPENSHLIDTIVKHATETPEQSAASMIPELGEDELSQAELTSLKLELQNSSKLAVLSRNILLGVVIVGVAMSSYFFFRFQTAQQSAFKASLTLTEVTTDKQNLQNSYNYKIYQVIDRNVTDLIWNGLELIQHYQNETKQQKNLRNEINQRLQEIGSLAQSLTVFDAEDPKAYRADLARELPADLKTTSVREIIRNKTIHEELANDKRLKSVIDLPIEEFVPWLEAFINDLEVPEASLLAINNDRLLWSKIITEIEDATRQIDPFFGNEEEQFIKYSNYNFNARTNQITVTGQIRTEDERTFTKIANLIDAIETSPNFRNVQTRSFNKNPVSLIDAELNEFYEATLKLDFEFIRQNDEAEPDSEPTNS